jgi:hypothetical protein
MNEPILLRIAGLIAIVGALFVAASDWATPLRWWQLPLLVLLFGIAAFIRSFLIEQGYLKKR